MNREKLKSILVEHEKWLNENGGERADLRGADLRYADLRYANLRGAYLQLANLRDANLQRADLRGADLRYADLRYANLRDVDLRYANLRYANLQGAVLRGSDLPNFIIVPEEGSFIAWKKCKDHLVKLEIPEDAKRISSITGRKCRASKAKVIEIFDGEGNKTEDTEAFGRHDETFKYTEGEMVYPDKFDDDIRIECSHGIHFFITKKEALEW